MPFLNINVNYYKELALNSIFVIFLFIYNCISSMYLLLPPLFGVIFLYFSRIVYNKQYYCLFIFTLCLFLCEVDKGYYPGVLFVIYSIIYIFLSPKIIKTFKNFSIFEFIYVPIIYVTYIILNDFLILLGGGSDIKVIIPMLFWYIMIESIIVLVIRWASDIK